MNGMPAKRISLRICFRARTTCEFISHHAKDIDEKKIFIRCPSPPSVGTRLSFELLLKDKTPLFAGTGTVVATRHRRGGDPGFWIGFENLQPQGLEILERVAEHKNEDITDRFPVDQHLLQAERAAGKPVEHQVLLEDSTDIFIIEGNVIRRY